MGRFRKSSYTSHEFYDGHHRFEHWYRDNTLYFITSRVRDGFAALESEPAKLIFWDRFDYYTKLHGFTPCVCSLLDNHCHTVGHLKVGEELGEMMRKLHGSVAWMVMKETDVRHVPFWRISPSPGTPGEGRGEGLPLTGAAKNPHPRPFPDYGSTELAEVRERE